MAYKVGTTIVIDDSGNVDWSRITNKPVIGAGDITSVGVVNGGPGSGQSLGGLLSANGGNCACTSNCYVTSLSGGGTTGAVSITANRAYFNCNCNCRC
jgi:hypothetical protein